jgi:hypothetical protein
MMPFALRGAAKDEPDWRSRRPPGLARTGTTNPSVPRAAGRPAAYEFVPAWYPQPEHVPALGKRKGLRLQAFS